MKHSMAMVAILAALVWCAAEPAHLSAQARSAEAATPASAASPTAVPRMPDGHPDLSGVWWRGADIGGRGGPPLGGRGGAAGGPPPSFASLYQPSAKAKAKTLADKDDPSLGCVPTAFGTLNVSLFDVGAVGQIVQTPKFLVMLTETYHGFQIIPFDGRPHRDNVPPSNRGDAVGHWDGDTLVVDKSNFSDTTWISAEGRISFHSDALHIVERYRRVDANHLEIEATLEDPKVLTGPWTVPKQTLLLAPFDQIMELACEGTEAQSLINAAAQQSPAKN
ncbi:MAG TPA: hypothetical protein VLY24_26755 [Bryobacteraceae bacterium]|nr:hypothetical protein [Bryobacteraceae bacterium]